MRQENRPLISQTYLKNIGAGNKILCGECLVMKKTLILLEIIVILITFVACRGLSPFSYPSTKWSASGLDLYVDSQQQGYLTYESPEETMLFKAEFLYGNVLRVYKYSELDEQSLELVWEYFPVGINNKEKCTFSTSDFKDESYSDVFPEKLILERKSNITDEDIEEIRKQSNTGDGSLS